MVSRSICGLIHGIIVILFLIGPIAIGSVFEWNLLGVLTVYGLANLVHYLVQFISALLNRRWVEGLPVDLQKSFGILVVGHQEDEFYFRKCLEKIRAIEKIYPNLKRIWIVQDGEEGYMTEIVKDVFSELEPCLIKTEPFYEISVKDRNLLTERMRHKKVVSIEQKHRGKRDAMFTAFYTAIHLNDIEFILCTDSDTWILPSAPEELLKLTGDFSVGAVTGHVRIFNIKNLLALLIELKYYFAFNLERSAQSFYGSVGCVSGPLGMYRVSALEKILYPWKEQTFLGKPCTFGDDRRLTALLLREGYKIHYTHKAVCYTETPTVFSRWIQQQSRWGRSYIREFLLGIPYFYKTNWYLVYDSCHLFFYSCFLFALTVKLLLEIEFHSILYIIGASIVVAGTRALYGIFLEKDPIFILFSFFGVVYFCFLLPTKLWSAVTIGVNRWGTSGRRFVKTTWLDCWPIVPWIGFILYGITRSAIGYDFLKIPVLAWVCVAGTGIIFIVSLIVFFCRRTDLYQTEFRLSETVCTDDYIGFPNQSVLEVLE